MEEEEQHSETESTLVYNERKGDIVEFTDIVGDSGKWQRRIFFITLFSGVSQVWNNLGISFLAFPVDHWCTRPVGNNISLHTWKNLYLPNTSFDGKVHPSQCEKYIFNFSIDSTVQVSSEIERCKSYEYATDYHSIVEEWDMVCDKAWMLSMSQSVYMFGFLLAVALTGHVSDLYGRRLAILMNLVILLIADFATAFSTSFIMFTILRSFIALGQAGLDLAIFVLLAEIFGSTSRATYIMLQSFGYCTGYMLLPLIAWLLSDWFYLQLAFTIPCFFYISCYWMIPESPRWLLSKGYIKEALSILTIAAKQNGVEVQNMEEKLRRISYIEKKKEEIHKKATFIDLLKTPNLRKKTLCLFFIWITLTFTYYGLSLYSNELYGNKFLNFFFAGLSEIPSSLFCLLTLNRYGRKKSLFLALLIGGLACIGFLFIPRGYEGIKTVLALSGRMFVSGAFSIIYLFSAEIFPTVTRNVGIGMCSMVARIGSALSPFMKDLGQATNPSVPLVLFGLLCILSSFLLLKLPETNRQPIPETIDEAERTFGNMSAEKQTSIELS